MKRQKRTRSGFSKEFLSQLISKNVEADRADVEVLHVLNVANSESTLKEWIEEVIVDDFILNGSTSKFISLEKYKKLAVPILLKMCTLVQTYEIEIFKYSEFREIIRKASLGECFSEAESLDEDSPSDDEVDDM